MRRVFKRAALQIPAIARLYRHRDELLAANAAAVESIAALTAERERLVAENARLTAETAALASERERLIAERVELTSAVAALGAERDGLIAARDRLSDELERDRAETALLIAERQRIDKELAAAVASNESLAGERERLRSEVARLSARVVHDEPPLSEPARSAPEKIADAIAAASAQAALSGPLVSIVCVARNAEQFVARAIASMQAQIYGNVELLFQDGASTDRTLDIVRGSGNLNLVSEPDQATLDGLLRAAARAKGEIIGVCWADDELLPHAAGWAAAMFRQHPADIVYGDQLFVHDDGGAEWIAEGSPWERAKFLRQEFFPPFSSSFFRRTALLALAERLTVFDHDEFEFWLWLDRLGTILHVPGLVSKFHVHGGSRWTKPGYCETMVRGRRRAIAQFAAAEGERAAALGAEAELGLELWAALHEISCTGSIEHSLSHLERIQEGFNGDPRFLMTLARLLNESKRRTMSHGDRILRVAQRLGFDVGVLAARSTAS
jgi:glycosyltransferase involved in cell wall biosynthesis